MFYPDMSFDHLTSLQLLVPYVVLLILYYIIIMIIIMIIIAGQHRTVVLISDLTHFTEGTRDYNE